MKYFEDVSLLTREIDRLGNDMLEAFLTENFDKLKKIFDTMDVLNIFLRNTIEFIILQQNRNAIEIFFELKNSVESKGTKYTVDKEFTVLARGEGENELEEINLYFKNDKIEDIEDVTIKANAIYVSLCDDYSFEATSNSENELEDILFFDTKSRFKRKFLSNNAKEVIKEKKLCNTELAGIKIEVV